MVCCFSKASDGFMQAKSLKSACGLSASNHLNKKGKHWNHSVHASQQKKRSKSFFKTHMLNKFYAPNTFWNGWTGRFVPWAIDVFKQLFSSPCYKHFTFNFQKSKALAILMDHML